MLGLWLDLMVLKVFSTLNVSVIYTSLRCIQVHLQTKAALVSGGAFALDAVDISSAGGNQGSVGAISKFPAAAQLSRVPDCCSCSWFCHSGPEAAAAILRYVLVSNVSVL